MTRLPRLRLILSCAVCAILAAAQPGRADILVGQVSVPLTTDSLSLFVSEDTGAGTVHARCIGPSAAWFSWGFDIQSHVGYAVVSRGATAPLLEYNMPGYITPTLQTIQDCSNVTLAANGPGTVAVAFDRLLNDGDALDFTFPAVPDSITLSWGVGLSETFNKHVARGTVTLYLRSVLGVPPAVAPSQIFLAEPVPNPSASRSRMDFLLPSAGNARLAVFDAAGRRVRVLADQAFGAGRHEAEWDGLDDAGRRLGGGIYFVELAALGRTYVRRITTLP